ncbi:MAG: hypothetical protein GOMPHAMPRED_001157 [Gomphillus americanus]|uniref:Uncharacterized protein n=1 Tax=Gomphillus americanus TaxID=1940652 RepID=A0A8H3F0D2_9LECA|nr:MAG: hypothetical protein GOMPHAMPRED_001157 [Gomphillus americanus]
MRTHNALNDEEANQAAKIALKGAGIGAIKYGAFLLPLFIIGQSISPVYRGLTIQFKVFLMMSGMVVGGAIEGDRRMREFEVMMRKKKRLGLR